jgi:hypothetical protein
MKWLVTFFSALGSWFFRDNIDTKKESISNKNTKNQTSIGQRLPTIKPR